MRTRGPIALLTCALALAACGGGEEETPEACLQGQFAFTRALADAPGKVRLAGGTSIGGCLIRNQPAGELERVGSALVATASGLNLAAQRDPGGPESVAAGYLAGAVAAGAERTEGIHADLARRVESAARFFPERRRPPAAFARAYARGFAAAQADAG